MIGAATDYRLASAHADCGAVARLWRVADATVNLLQHRIINIRSERIFDRAQIGAVSVRCKLNAMCQAVCQIVHEVIRATRIALANEPAGNQFRVRTNCSPSPNIACALFLHFNGAILFLCSDETPNLIGLEALTFQIHESSVLILGAGATEIAEKFHDCIFRDASHARGGTNAVALNQAGNNLRSL